MRFLVTGGAGFIGGHLVESLLADKHEVVVIDDLSTGSLENLAAVASDDRLETIVADILDFPDLTQVVASCDVVYHLAAAVGVELVVKDPVRTIMTNVHGTERVLNAAVGKSVRTIIASTSEVYGKSEKELFSEDDDLLIGPPTRSRWSYACSKLIDEFMAMAYHKASQQPVVVARFFNTVGPRQTGRYGMVLPRFVKSALSNDPLSVYGDGRQTRCFCHVKDTVRAIRALAGCDAALGQVFNIGSDRPCSINELADMVIQRTKSASGVKHIPYEEAYEPGFEDMLHRRPNTDKIRALVGWKPERSLEQIVDDVAACLRSSAG